MKLMTSLTCGVTDSFMLSGPYSSFSSNKKLVETSASLLGTSATLVASSNKKLVEASALLVVTRSY